MKFTLIIMCAAMAVHTNMALASHDHHHSHTLEPIGVMGAHTHEKGKWMTSYRYGYMKMDGVISGSDSISNSQIAANSFMIAPEDMSMQMHMFGLMYGLSDSLTLMVMASYKDMEMDHVFVNGMNAGSRFTTRSRGFGDTKLTALYTLKEWGNHQLQLNAGVSLPTGSTDETDVNSVTGMEVKLPYPMQLGSGTYDLLPGLTYTGHHGKWGWGTQANATLRLGENSDDYTLGDEYQLTAWGSHQLTDMFSTSLRINAKSWDNIDGADPAFTNLNMSPMVRTDMRGGERIDVGVGFNIDLPKTKLAENRLGVEVLVPVYQDLDGIQLETDYSLVLGWQLRF